MGEASVRTDIEKLGEVQHLKGCLHPCGKRNEATKGPMPMEWLSLAMLDRGIFVERLIGGTSRIRIRIAPLVFLTLGNLRTTPVTSRSKIRLF